LAGVAVAIFHSVFTFWKPPMSHIDFDTQALISASECLGVKFKRFDMLACALTHPSIMAERLLGAFPNESEGELARRYAALVSTATLADVARRMRLASHVKFSRGEEAQNGADNSANLADTCEAVIGAVYLDSGLEEARTFIEREWAELILGQEEPPRDPKTELQEWTQARSLGLPQYKVISQGGPAHSPTFIIEVHVPGFSSTMGKGKSKRHAERVAAERMLTRLYVEGEGLLSKSD